MSKSPKSSPVIVSPETVLIFKPTACIETAREFFLPGVPPLTEPASLKDICGKTVLPAKSMVRGSPLVPVVRSRSSLEAISLPLESHKTTLAVRAKPSEKASLGFTVIRKFPALRFISSKSGEEMLKYIPSEFGIAAEVPVSATSKVFSSILRDSPILSLRLVISNLEEKFMSLVPSAERARETSCIGYFIRYWRTSSSF